MSPSALSRNIRILEDEAGTVLFERDNRRVALTPAGGLFLDYARDALAQWDAVRGTLLEQADALHGELSIYCSVTASYSFLFHLLSRFRSDHPAIEIKLHTGDPEHAMQRVQAGSEDIAIGARPDMLPATLAFRSIAETPLVFIAARDAPYTAARAAGSPDAQIWGTAPMVVPEGGIARRRVDAWFRKQNLQPNIYAQVEGNEAIVSMVSLGFGIGVVPKIVLDNSPLVDTVRILRVRPRLDPYDVGVFTLQRRLRSPLISAFWSRLK